MGRRPISRSKYTNGFVLLGLAALPWEDEEEEAKDMINAAIIKYNLALNCVWECVCVGVCVWPTAVPVYRIFCNTRKKKVTSFLLIVSRCVRGRLVGLHTATTMERLGGSGLTVTRYPRNVNVNFRKLSKEALMKVATRYELDVKGDVTHDDLASLIARKFEATSVSAKENEVVDKVANKFCRAAAVLSNKRKKQRVSRELIDAEPARQGEQVAAKVLKTNENGSWILGNILDFNGNTYEVQDEDDVTRKVTLGFNEVRRLMDTASHLRRGDEVLAVFPETTSFYRATVVKNPRPPSSVNGNWEVIVKFEDDEDDSGKAPPRRVPARFVLRRDDVEPDEDDDDGDD
jgi:hypothetical protein